MAHVVVPHGGPQQPSCYPCNALSIVHSHWFSCVEILCKDTPASPEGIEFISAFDFLRAYQQAVITRTKRSTKEMLIPATNVVDRCFSGTGWLSRGVFSNSGVSVTLWASEAELEVESAGDMVSAATSISIQRYPINSRMNIGTALHIFIFPFSIWKRQNQQKTNWKDPQVTVSTAKQPWSLPPWKQKTSKA